jgi:excinuclease UvrABC ATPase subunit
MSVLVTPEGVALIVAKTTNIPKYVREHTCSRCRGWIGKITTCTCKVNQEPTREVSGARIENPRELVSTDYSVVEDRYDPESFP